MREIGYGKRNATWGDYTRFRLLWTCPQAAEKIMASPSFKTYPGYIRESLEERMRFNPVNNYYPDYPPIIGLPRGMEFVPCSDLKGEPQKTAEFIVRNNLVAITIEARDWDKIEVPPGFLTDLSFNPLTKIPEKK